MRFTLTKFFSRQINSLVKYLGNALFSRNFCQKSVIVNFRNFHNVALHNVEITEILSHTFLTKISWNQRFYRFLLRFVCRCTKIKFFLSTYISKISPFVCVRLYGFILSLAKSGPDSCLRCDKDAHNLFVNVNFFFACLDSFWTEREKLRLFCFLFE